MNLISIFSCQFVLICFFCFLLPCLPPSAPPLSPLSPHLYIWSYVAEDVSCFSSHLSANFYCSHTQKAKNKQTKKQVQPYYHSAKEPPMNKYMVYESGRDKFCMQVYAHIYSGGR